MRPSGEAKPGEAALREVERDVALFGNGQSVGEGVRAAGEETLHFMGRTQMPGADGFVGMRLVEQGEGADGGEGLENQGMVGMRAARFADGDDGEAEGVGEPGAAAGDGGLGGGVDGEFDVEAVLESVAEGGGGRVSVLPAQQADETAGDLAEIVRGERPIAEVVDGDEAAEIAVAGEVAGEEDDGDGAVTGAKGFAGSLVPRRDSRHSGGASDAEKGISAQRQFGAEDGLDAGSVAGLLEPDGGVETAQVGEGDGGHAVGDGEVDELPWRSQGGAEGVSGAVVERNKAISHRLSAFSHADVGRRSGGFRRFRDSYASMIFSATDI